MALIDLETTPMVPIPPPETRVGVPPDPRGAVDARDRQRESRRRGAAGDEPGAMDAEPAETADLAATAAPAADPGRGPRSARATERPGGGRTPPPARPRKRAATSRSAEQAYWRAASIEAEPALRANYLVAHARVLLARGDVETARGQLESARERAPGHVGAGALLADISYRTQDWARARELYTLLDSAPEVADVLPRELLVQRRAMLADRFGDADEAEALYRELAILNPQHLGARKALAELARARGDLPGAVQRLEEVLRLMPSDASGDLLDVRQRLGAMYAELGEWESARHYLELVLAQDPGARARAGAAAGGVRPPRDAGGGGQGLRAPGPPVLRTVAARRRPLSPGGDPARSAGQSGGRAGRLPALFGSRSDASSRRACAWSITSGTSATWTSWPSWPTISAPSRCRRTASPT